MTIYIESFLIQNTLINLCLLKLINTTTKTSTTFFKLLFASIVGATSSIVVIFFFNNTLIVNALKLFTAILMITLAFKQGKKQFLTNLILLFLFTYCFGGLITNFSTQTYQTSFGIITTSKINLEFICISIFVLTYIFELVLKHIKTNLKINKLIYTTTLTLGNNTIKINSYLDTGNMLNIAGSPVLILNLDDFLKLSNMNIINFHLSKTQEISTSTVNGNKKLKVFNVDKIELSNGKHSSCFINTPVAISHTNFQNTNYQALISPLFL